MNELLNNIILYAKEHNQFSAPALQDALHIGYRELTAALETLQENGTISFLGGMRYEYHPGTKKNARLTEIQSDNEDDLIAQRRAYLEMRRQEIIRRIQAEVDDDDDDDDIDDDDDDVITPALEETSDRETTYPIQIQVLHYCVQCQRVSTPLILRKFPIGFFQSEKIINWMEAMGYITSSNGSAPRKVLLTEERFKELYGAENEDKKEVKDSAEYSEAAGKLCDLLRKVSEEKDHATHISEEFFDELKEGVGGDLFEVYRSVCYVQICAKGLTFCNGEKAEFFIHHYGKITELCDGGVTSEWLQRKPGYGYKRTRNLLRKLTDGLMIRMDDRGQLFVDISDLSKLPARYYYFYWTIESLIA